MPPFLKLFSFSASSGLVSKELLKYDFLCFPQGFLERRILIF